MKGGHSNVLTFILLFMWYYPSRVFGHGRLVEPPSRSSMWRFGFKTKPNYNDNELFCGGYTVQWQSNGGKCGVCGDAWHIPPPRPNEAGGTYGRGIIVRRYSPGQVITSTVEITANHRGFFEFKLCPHNSPKTIVSQECLDRTPLELADGSGYRYYPSFGTGPFKVQLRLPQHLTCSQCVFQWTYTAGNNWGQCENGTSKVGCGAQETFRGCADVAVGESEANDIPSYEPNISQYGPVRPSAPPRKPPPRQKERWSQPARPTRPTQRRKPSRRPSIKPYYANRGPPPSKKPTSKRPNWPSYSRRPYPTSDVRKSTSRPYQSSIPRRTTPRPYPVSSTRRTTIRPRYTSRSRYHSTTRKPTYRPSYSEKPSYPKPNPTKKPRPRKPKPTKKTYEAESEDMVGSCRAVGAWKTVSGIASWCNVNCPRGYCPPSHCDCSRRR